MGVPVTYTHRFWGEEKGSIELVSIAGLDRLANPDHTALSGMPRLEVLI